MPATKDIRIERGPSREDLFDALRLRHEGRTVKFCFSETEFLSVEASAQVNGINIEDGSGHSWIIACEFRNFKWFRLAEIYYDDKGRKGTVLKRS